MTDVDVEIATLVRHLNDANPRYTTDAQTVFVHNETTGTDSDCRGLGFIILQLHINIAGFIQTLKHCFPGIAKTKF